MLPRKHALTDEGLHHERILCDKPALLVFLQFHYKFLKKRFAQIRGDLKLTQPYEHLNHPFVLWISHGIWLHTHHGEWELSLLPLFEIPVLKQSLRHQFLSGTVLHCFYGNP